MALTDQVAVARKTMVLFFMVDCSGSMDGSKIGAVNNAIEEVIPEIRKISDENADAEIKVAALEFCSGSRWITKDGPVSAEQFVWKTLDAAGQTDMGDACKSLAKKLSTKEDGFMQAATGSYAPAIFLMSDGQPNDDDNGFEKGLAILKQNNWFKAAVKVAVAIGDDADEGPLVAFTGNKESVVRVHDSATLKRLIKFVSVTSSQVASQSSHAKDGVAVGEAKQTAINDAIAGFVQEQGGTTDANTPASLPPTAGADPDEIW
jgi:uncharacterized protein YegL